MCVAAHRLQELYIRQRDRLMLASDAIKPLLSVLVLCGWLTFPSEWKQFTSGFMDAPMLCLLRPVAVQVGGHCVFSIVAAACSPAGFSHDTKSWMPVAL
jgi:hypothetical protein